MLQRPTRAYASLAKASPTTALAVTSLLAFACSAPPGLDGEADGPPEFVGSPPALSMGSTPAPAPGAPSSPGASAPVSNTGEQNAAAGAPIAPSTPPPSGSQSGANANAGANPGTGGSSMTPPGSGEMPPPVTPPADQPPPEGQPEQPPEGTPPAPPAPVIDTECPDGALFCAGFEQPGFPVGTANIFGGTQFENGFQLDTTEFNSGSQSFFLPSTNQAFSYRVMAIPVPVQAFWSRIFVLTDTLLGDADHDGIFAISSGDLTTDNNNETRVEFSEQEGTIVLNRSTDQITFPISRPANLPANTWHCIETRFDGDSGDIEVFANGQLIISSLGNAQFQFQVQTFRIGTLQFHSPRNVWFDDVVLNSDRIGCD